MTTTAQVPRSGPFTGDGSTIAFTYSFLIEDRTQLVVDVVDTTTNVITTKALTTDYSVANVGNVAGGTVTFVTAPTANEQVAFTRATALAQDLDLQNRGVVSPQLLEEKLDDLTRIAQELSEQIGRAIKTDLFSTVDQAQFILYIDLLAGIEAEIVTVAGISANVTTVAGISADVTTVAGISAYIIAVAAIAADVTTVATNIAAILAASTDAANAAASALAAAASETAAAASALAADASAIAAGAAEGGALAAQAAAELALDEFTDLYLGAKAVEPTLDNDGNALQIGAQYFNTVTLQMNIYNGSSWTALVGGGGLFKGNNGEVGDPSTGVGDIFRINAQTLTVSTTIDATENASAAGPLTVDTGVTLIITSGGSLVIV